VIRSVGREWLIGGEPPGELLELESVEPTSVSADDRDDERESSD
jgi:hypothetical protein